MLYGGACRSRWQQVSNSLHIRSGRVVALCLQVISLLIPHDHGFQPCHINVLLITFAVLLDQSYLVLEGFECTKLSPLLLWYFYHPAVADARMFLKTLGPSANCPADAWRRAVVYLFFLKLIASTAVCTRFCLLSSKFTPAFLASPRSHSSSIESMSFPDSPWHLEEVQFMIGRTV